MVAVLVCRAHELQAGRRIAQLSNRLSRRYKSCAVIIASSCRLQNFILDVQQIVCFPLPESVT